MESLRIVLDVSVSHVVAAVCLSWRPNLLFSASQLALGLPAAGLLGESTLGAQLQHFCCYVLNNLHKETLLS